MKILAFGEIIWDIYPDGAFIGGAPFNFCAHCVKCGIDGKLISAVGNDGLYENTISAVKAVGISSGYIETKPFPTGRCEVTLDKNMTPSFNVISNVAYDNITVGNEITASIRRECFDAFYFGTLAQRGSVSRRSLANILTACEFGEIFCDINLRQSCYDNESIGRCFENATILKLSAEEVSFLYSGDYSYATAPNRVFASHKKLHTLIITRGADGASIYSREGECISVPAVGDSVVSTVGAGDSFSAVWLSMYLSGKTRLEAAKIAARVSGYVVSVKEAVPEYKIERFINDEN